MILTVTFEKMIKLMRIEEESRVDIFRVHFTSFCDDTCFRKQCGLATSVIRRGCSTTDETEVASEHFSAAFVRLLLAQRRVTWRKPLSSASVVAFKEASHRFGQKRARNHLNFRP